MTTESSDVPFVQLQAVGVPFSVVRVPLMVNEAGGYEIEYTCNFAVEIATALTKAYRAANASDRDDEEITRVPIDDTGHEQPTEPQAIAYCPQHKVPMRESAPQYNPKGDKFYHPLPENLWTKDARGADVKNHTLYWRLTVDANGESNQGKVIPQPVGAR